MRHYGARVTLAVLTGMGDDGLAGARAVKAAGGTVLVEAERTCVVWGMPRSIEEAGLADAVIPLDAMPLAIAEAAGRRAGRLPGGVVSAGRASPPTTSASAAA